jgi:hypothetical protein
MLTYMTIFILTKTMAQIDGEDWKSYFASIGEQAPSLLYPTQEVVWLALLYQVSPLGFHYFLLVYSAYILNNLRNSN